MMIKSALLSLLFLFLAACGGSGERVTRADEAAAAGILLRGNGNDPETLDPHLATTVSAGNILFNLYEGLTRFHPETLKPEPAMAEAWQVSEDGLEYTFNLREAHWSNGDPVLASDFVYAWRRILNPDLAANYAYMLFALENAGAVHDGNLPREDLGVEAVDERTLRVRLERPVPYFLSLLTHWTWFPLHERSLVAAGATTDRTVLWTRPETMVVNGAFRLTEWQPGNHLRIRKNERYWQAETVELNGADFIPYADADTEERAFRGGAIHLTYSFPLQRLNHYRKNQPEVLRIDPYLQSNAWVINVKRPGLDDVRVRKALAISIDRRRITERVLGNVREPAFSYAPPGRDLLREDPDAARALLAEAGYPKGEGLPELELILPAARDWVRVAEVLQQQWARVGLRVQINSMERTTYFSRRREGAFDLCFLGWVGDYPDPETFLGLFRTEAGNNLAQWSNATYDELLDQAALPGADRAALLAEAEALLMEEVPVIPVAFGSTQFLLDPRVKNWHPNLLDHHPLRVVKFQEP
ncbi:MAG: peptide ABC transporter substrate-binding protein [Kiritimatiellae bacterium]|nr:peptide ABC transporter substrate-binding protein [Kiritimatiellia bacterium]